MSAATRPALTRGTRHIIAGRSPPIDLVAHLALHSENSASCTTRWPYAFGHIGSLSGRASCHLLCSVARCMRTCLARAP